MFNIIFEDQDLLVVNKPFGVVVNRANTVKSLTVQDWMTERLHSIDMASQEEWVNLLPASFTDEYGIPEEIFANRHGIVHRLDKDTSGALLLAKNPGALVNLLYQFKARTVQKRYRCLVHGIPQVRQATLRFPIARRPRAKMLFGVVPDGRPASTEYEVLETFSGPNFEVLTQEHPQKKQLVDKMSKIYQGFSLLDCHPLTGRTHQIRVHLQHIGHPIVGDRQYAGRKRAKLDAMWCQRQFLHAFELAITHPRTQLPLAFTAPLQEDLVQVLELLK